MLSNTCKYGIRAMVYLAVHFEEEKNIGIKKISKDLELPAPFLGKILQNIVKEGMLSSTKGPHGGFLLKKRAEDITMYDIVKVIDGDSIFEDCLLGLKICENDISHMSECPFRERSHKVRSELKATFQSQTLANFAESINSSDKDIRF